MDWHHIYNCADEYCEYCLGLVEDGILESCDGCGEVGHTDFCGWIGELDSEGRCSIYCLQCAKDLRNE